MLGGAKGDEREKVASQAEWNATVCALLERAESGAPHMLGYPVSTNLTVQRSAFLPALLSYHWQQGPDPMIQLPIVPYAANAREIEPQVVKFVADLYKGKDCWGYVASGGHESNRSALLTARKKYEDSIVYFSGAAHYGVRNLAEELRMAYRVVPIYENGCMNVDALMEMIDRDKPVIIVATLGTTMLGAIDDIRAIIALLDREKITHRYIHCDAALHGNYLPFMKETADINFEALPIHSLAVSPYKGWGSPTPNSVFLVNEHLYMQRDAEYVKVKAGETHYIPSSSRSGLASIGAMDGFVRVGGRAGMQAEVERRMALTQYAVRRLSEAGADVFANPNSTIIAIKNLPMDLQFIEYWQLKLEGETASIVVSGHVTKEVLDRFAEEFASKLPATNTAARL